jgi:hypothetical protein
MKNPGIRFIIRSALLFSTQVLFSVLSFSQTHTPRTITVNSNFRGYYEYLPINYSSSSTFPLIVYCGGAGSFGNGTASQLVRLLPEGIPYYINNNQFPSSFTVNGQTSSFIVISPQFVAWPGPADVEAVLNYIISSGYKVDQSRIYLTGFSAGGDVTWKYPNTGLLRSKRLAAIVPVAAYNYPYVDTGAHYMASANLPVWALHSNDDQSAPSTWSQNFVNKINSYNPPILARITRVNGPSHDGSKTYFHNPAFRVGGYNIYEWMLLYRRNYPPVAIAGNDIAITLPVNSAQLNGLNSYDPENGPLTFNWVKITGPSPYLISNPGIGNPVVSNLVAGNYSFQLTVTDTSGLFGRDTVSVTVINPYPNNLPFARAGEDQQINLPQNAVVLNGTASSDSGGSIESYLWTKISGPSQFTITGNTTSIASVSNLRSGNYLFRLAVTDNEGGSGYDTIQITVINPFPNQLPVANAGNDVLITLPVNSVNLNAAASYDPDGIIVNYLWSQLSGPAAALIATPGNVNSNVQNLIPGSYQFLVTVTDDSSAVDTDTIAVIVQPAPLVTSKFIKVNLFGGTNPYNQGGWNNWNVTGTTNITSSNFNYSDGAASTVNAILSYSQGVPDNGASYGGTMCPPEVLRFTTYATSGRTVTVRGLNNALNYDLELYASRASTGNTTQFVINGVTQSVLTDNNKTDKVIFTNLTPVAGQLVITINKLNTFTYLNGFTLSEKSSAPPPGNQLPVANAGADQMITLPAASVTLNGSASSDPDGYISSYLWTKVAGPSQFTIVNANSSSTVVNNLTSGIYLFELTVTDNSAATDKDTVQVIVNSNLPPGSGDSLNCGKVFTIVVLGSSTAYGTGATPIDSSCVNKYLNYIRSKHPLNTIINLATLSLTSYEVLCPTGFVPPANRPWFPDPNRNITKALTYHPDAIIINLPSNDIALGIPQQESKDNYERTMALADSANIPVWVTTTQPRSTLSPQERIYLMEFRDWTYQRFGAKAIDFWTNVANPDGTINDFYNFGDGVHVNNNGHQLFSLRIISERILDSLCIRKNLSPAARAGNDTAIVLPVNSIQLNGSASSDADGTISAYLWSKISGPAAGTLTNANTATPTASALAGGVYSYQLTVTDNLGATGKDTVNVVVNQRPTANAGPNIIITLPTNTATLSGSGTDPDGTITAYAWVKIAGPAAGTITNANTATATASDLVTGVYSYQLTVTDNFGATGKDTVNVTVNPASNQPPIANAGADITITLPTNTATLSGSGTDPDGTIAAYAWIKVAGPAAGTLTNANTATATASALQAGVYSYQLTVTDTLGATGKDTVNVTVNPAPNQPPIANAGPNITITLPINTATLSGSGTDPDGTITAYAWIKIAGPAAGTLTNANTATATAGGLVAGVYSYQLTVTDNLGATGRDTAVVTINNALPPGPEKYIKVNLFDGSNPYNQGGWNNWNVTGVTNITSSNFNYSDGTASTVNAILSYSQGIPDNGATYGGTMCPPEVLRFTTYTTSARTVTLRGLNNALKYDLELYASRATTGNSTQFVINGLSQTVLTDNNKTIKATFANLTPTAGQLLININKLNTFTYLNGFTLTQRADTTMQTRQITTETSGVNVSEYPTQQPTQFTVRGEVEKQGETPKAELFTVTALPNPSSSNFTLYITGNGAETVVIRIMDISGKVISITKLNGSVAYTHLGGNLKGGIYFAEVIQGNNRRVLKLIKLN